MLYFYFGPTPNARKISIAIEELGLEYELRQIDILAGDQFKPSFLAVNPNNKMPAIVDSDGPDGWPITVWESGAILLYLAEKHGRLLPAKPRDRIECLKWLMFQMAGLGPMSGQFAFFNFYAREKIPLAIERYEKELLRQMKVMDGHLQRNAYFAGEEYSIADIAIYPWWDMLQGVLNLDHPALNRWAASIAARPAVMRGMSMLTETLRPEVVQGGMTAALADETYSTLYGDRQHAQAVVPSS